MTLRYLPPSKILRDRAWEKEFGIDDLQIMTYIYDDVFDVVGQIQANKIIHRFYLALIAYAKDGSVLFKIKNDTYGGTYTTNVLTNFPFFTVLPFHFREYTKLADEIHHLKSYPVGYQNDKI